MFSNFLNEWTDPQENNSTSSTSSKEVKNTSSISVVSNEEERKVLNIDEMPLPALRKNSNVSTSEAEKESVAFTIRKPNNTLFVLMHNNVPVCFSTTKSDLVKIITERSKQLSAIYNVAGETSLILGNNKLQDSYTFYRRNHNFLLSYDTPIESYKIVIIPHYLTYSFVQKEEFNLYKNMTN